MRRRTARRVRRFLAVIGVAILIVVGLWVLVVHQQFCSHHRGAWYCLDVHAEHDDDDDDSMASKLGGTYYAGAAARLQPGAGG
jgi:hypothetical protein